MHNLVCQFFSDGNQPLSWNQAIWNVLTNHVTYFRVNKCSITTEKMLASPKNGVSNLNSWMKDKVKMPNDHQLRDGPQHSSNCEIFWHIMPMVMTMFMMTGRIPGPVQDNAGEVFIIGLFRTAPLISGHCTWCTRPVRCILITTGHSSIFVQIAPNLKIFDFYVPTTTS